MKQKSKTPVRVAITGAAGQIGYQLAFRIASGQLFGADQPIILQLLEITPALGALNGVAMELDDCAFETLHGVVVTDKAEVAFKDINYGLLVGARPRGPGMERKDLLQANAQIFSAQGKALDAVADRRVKILVVGNPANTNALIARENAKGLDPRNFTAMTRLDHNRAKAQLAAKTGTHVSDIRRRRSSGATTRQPSFRTSRTRRSAASRRCRASRRAGIATSSSRPCSSAAPRSSRRAARRRPPRPPRRRSTTSAIGRSARPATIGSAWPSRPTAATASRKASSTRTPCAACAATIRSSKGSPSTTSAARRWRATETELREERAGVENLL